MSCKFKQISPFLRNCIPQHQTGLVARAGSICDDRNKTLMQYDQAKETTGIRRQVELQHRQREDQVVALHLLLYLSNRRESLNFSITGSVSVRNRPPHSLAFFSCWEIIVKSKTWEKV